LPTCPKCEKFISDRHYERHLRRCGTPEGHKPPFVHTPSAPARGESANGGIDDGPPGEGHHGINWTKVAAGFVIFLLIGTVAVFFILYALSLL
jgi:hypothetical protein